MADMRASRCGAGRMEGGRASRSWSYYLYLAVRNHGVMHYMCSLLCREFKGAQTRERQEKHTFHSIRLTCAATDGWAQAPHTAAKPASAVRRRSRAVFPAALRPQTNGGGINLHRGENGHDQAQFHSSAQATPLESFDDDRS